MAAEAQLEVCDVGQFTVVIGTLFQFLGGRLVVWLFICIRLRHLRSNLPSLLASGQPVLPGLAHVRHLDAERGGQVVYTVGNHDGDLAWDLKTATAVRELTGAKLCLAADLHLPGGERVALELDLTSKSARDVDKVIAAYFAAYMAPEGAERITQLGNWLDTHPRASAGDIHAAQSMVQDLISAMCDEEYPDDDTAKDSSRHC